MNEKLEDMMDVVSGCVHFWQQIAEDKTTAERLEGLAFSLLVAVDGGQLHEVRGADLHAEWAQYARRREDKCSRDQSRRKMNEKMQVKIVSDGKPLDTKIMDSDTGLPIDKCYRAEIILDVNDLNRAKLHCYLSEVDVVADAEFEYTTIHNGRKYRLVPVEKVSA